MMSDDDDDTTDAAALLVEPTATTALLPHQVAHVNRLHAIWSERCFYLDTSPMGTGKTHAAAWMIRARGFAHVIVVCPLAVKSMWRRVLLQYGVIPTAILTYETLRSKRGCQPVHGLLLRTDSETGHVFAPTPLFRDYVRAGLCLVVDEFQRVKNQSAQQQAMQALCREIAQARLGQTKIALLSGTPFDKREQILRLLQLVIVIHSARMYTFHAADERLELNGAAEVIEYARTIDEAATAAVLNRTPFTRFSVVAACYDLYVHVIQNAVVSCMPPPAASHLLRCINGFYDVPEADVPALQTSIRALHCATRFDPDTEHVVLADADWYAISKALRGIELAKVGMFVRLAKHALDVNPRAKVVIALQFLDPIAAVAAALQAYAPLIVTGACALPKRDAHIGAFQAHDTTRRLLIGTLAVLELGIDLDDTHGEYPRYAFASPGYAVMRVHQFTRRFHRVHTQSDATVAFVFGKCAAIESSILNALRRKTQILSDTLSTQVLNGMRFPGDYDVYVEDDDRTGFDTAKLLREIQPKP